MTGDNSGAVNEDAHEHNIKSEEEMLAGGNGLLSRDASIAPSSSPKQSSEPIDMSDDEDQPVFSSIKKKSKSAVLNYSDDDSDDGIAVDSVKHIDSVNHIDSGNHIDSVQKNNEDSTDQTETLDEKMFDSENPSSTTDHLQNSENVSPVEKISLPSDIFDNESDSEHEANEATEEVSRESSNDEREPTEMSAALKRRLAKGASKKPAGGRKSQSSRKDEMIQIHSETQRLVRESSVRIPYHKPPKLDLSAFLARTQQKQLQLASLSTPRTNVNSSKPSWKQVTSSTFSLEKKSSTFSLEHKDVAAFSVCQDSSPSLADRLAGAGHSVLEISNTTEKKPLEHVANELQKNLDDDELPDLITILSNANKTHKDSDNLTNSNTNNDPRNSEQTCDAPSEPNKIVEKLVIVNDSTATNFSMLEDFSQSATSSILVKSHSIDTSCDSSLRKFITPKQNLLASHLPAISPRLSSGPNAYIDLDLDGDDSVDASSSAGINSLMDRLIKHSANKNAKKSKKQETSLVSKEKLVGNPEEAKVLELVSEEDSMIDTPGAKRLILKEKLMARMKLKREESMQKRYEMFDMEHSCGYEAKRMEEEALEEAELTDQSDTDKEEESEDEEEDAEEGIDEEEAAVDKYENNPFVDNEAEDEDEENDVSDEDEDGGEEDGGEEDEVDEESIDHAKTKKNLKMKNVEEWTSSSLRKTKTLELFDDDAVIEPPIVSQTDDVEINRPFRQVGVDKTLEDIANVSPPLNQLPDPMDFDLKDELNSSYASPTKDLSMVSVDSSCDMMVSLIPAGQKPRRIREAPISNEHTVSDNFPPSSTSSMQQKLDDDDDMSETKDAQVSQDNNVEMNADFNPNTQESGLDWLLGVTSDKVKSRKILDPFSLSQGNDNVDDELLQLCSGTFTDSADMDASRKKPFKSLFAPDSQIADSQSNMDQLLGLCSGQFTSFQDENKSSAIDKWKSNGDLFSRDDSDEDDGLLGVLSGQFTTQSQKNTESSPTAGKQSMKRKAFQLEEDDDGDDGSNHSFVIASNGKDAGKTNSVSDDDDHDLSSDEMEKKSVRFGGFRIDGKHGKIRREFVEDEAELSGDECESDEDLDLDENDDILEQEAGDQDDIGTEEELRDQVHRVHLKSLIDQDKRELRLLQEQYLPDGDLHSEGMGRMRRFRWSNADDDETQNDMFRLSDDEQVEGEDESEAKWRTERMEREKFLEQLKEKDTKENKGRVMKLGQAAFKPKSELSQSSCPAKFTAQEARAQLSSTVSDVTSLFKVPTLNRSGSFLHRSKESLAKMAELSKIISNPNLPRNSRNFVFSTISSTEENVKASTPSSVKPQIKTSAVNSRPPQNKRPCLEKSKDSVINSSRIFKLLDKAAC